jgi:hypothetical protein
MTHWMFNCKDVSYKISESMDRYLPYQQRLLIRFHLLMCRYCARFRRQLIFMNKLSRHKGTTEKVPPSEMTLSTQARERISKLLKAHR